MKNQLLKWVLLTLVTGPMLATAAPLGPILLPTGSEDKPDSAEVGDKPPETPKDPGNIQPELFAVAESSGPILVPSDPRDRPDETEIGDKPPDSPKDPGDIRPETTFGV
ncbi:hypothetical protein JY651_48545 [Pyxidicoccus parkwayensis]|uniref:Uncharacterized protein n=1 Tax=Pyxidicoccus parkwayensis TaxID=2813578 RepID=A0ABX7NVN9_9BACT|nr:hypothetical protein [Pyxidicoccus parkwaysis]QSQ22865.1 hypothetical protein JY651_48545 [Pyxidicoccus parkwaysis]